MAKRRFFFGVLLVLGAVTYLIYTGIRETSNYYLTLDEFLPQKEAFANEGIRLAGRVQAGSMHWDPKTLRLSFVLGPFKEKAQPALQGIAVHYQGILPDMFAEGRDVIVEGRYETGDALTAKTIMTSCPSKYEPALNAQPSTASAK
ncbi:MAG TPA: cytochrome c maturation protein CcmE [Methylomirabilota bacterium]|jgi:cytochrome c-type biogenesis protein CcmE|nr:cytochrome c maturation protein CcmE [Methylomirabilota bacterium]